jgi:hypothetical protein
MMKERLLVLFLLVGLILVWGCGSEHGTLPQHVAKPKQLAGHADDYVYVGVNWINRDGWDFSDGRTEHWFSVSYNYFAADWCYDFADKIDSSSVPNQTYWSQYTSYRPGGRNYPENPDDPEDPWTGTYCQGLVYRAAIKAGYSISSSYLYRAPTYWQDLGTEVPPGAQQEGDLILMDFDTTNNHPDVTYEHLGVMWGLMPEILSAVAIYYRPTFEFKAGIHTKADYDTALAAEFPDQNLRVYDRKYIRLPE